MSPATLYQFEANIESAALRALEAAGVSPAFTRLTDTASLPAARVVVQASGFTRASGHMAFARDRQPFYNHYTGQLAYLVTTPRTGTPTLTPEQSRALHSRWLGLIRSLMQRPLQAFVCPGYEFKRVEESASSVTFVQEGERDRSELVYDLEPWIMGPMMDHAAV